MKFNETKCSLSLIPRYVSPEENELNSPEIVERKNRIRRLCFFGTYDQNNSEWLEFQNNYSKRHSTNEAIQSFNHENDGIGNVLNESITTNFSQKCLQNR